MRASAPVPRTTWASPVTRSFGGAVRISLADHGSEVDVTVVEYVLALVSDSDLPYLPATSNPRIFSIGDQDALPLTSQLDPLVVDVDEDTVLLIEPGASPKLSALICRV